MKYHNPYLKKNGISVLMFLCYDILYAYTTSPTHAIISLWWDEIGVWPYLLSSAQDVITSPAGARLPRPQKLITIDN